MGDYLDIETYGEWECVGEEVRGTSAWGGTPDATKHEVCRWCGAEIELWMTEVRDGDVNEIWIHFRSGNIGCMKGGAMIPDQRYKAERAVWKDAE